MPGSQDEPLPAVEGVTEASEAPRHMSKAEAIAKIKEAQAELERIATKTGPSGAMPRATKAMLLDASGAIAKNPDHRIRWVNIANNEKAQLRFLSGYKRLTEEQGGRQVGNLVLCAIPREIYEQRVAELRELHVRRLKSHRTDMQKAAEGLVQQMRDQYGVKVNVTVEDLLINQGSEG